MALAACVVASGCREPTPTQAQAHLFATPAMVAFPPTYVGKTVDLQIELRSSARYRLTAKFTPPAPPFFLVDPPAELAIGSTKLTVRYAPIDQGTARAVLAVDAEGERASVSLYGVGLAIPACPEAPTCHRMVFDLAVERCVEQAQPDGTSCDPHNQCVSDAVCRAGACEGLPRSCDDGNACTVDFCNALDGCQAAPAPPCPDDLAACKLGVCDPAAGCGFKWATDGTLCDPDASTCSGVHVCINHTCEVRAPSPTYVCAEATPCQGPGKCVGADCVQPDPVPLTSPWNFDSAALEASWDNELHDFVLEPSGAISLSGWFAKPRFRANTASPLSPDGNARRCILWNDRALCLDYPWQQGTVAMIDLATGVPAWIFDLPTVRPDFEAQAVPGNLYLSRIAAMGTDRFAALFEAYPREAGVPTNCRAYFLVILDPGGRMLHATRLTDAFLNRCDHPHPYGFSADTVGNIYILFSPSTTGNPPLEPGTPSRVISYSKEGALRWTRDLDVRGGELAVSRGALYPEQGKEILSAATGVTVGTGAIWGRAVVTETVAVQAPPPLGLGRGNLLSGYVPGTGTQRWLYRLGAGSVFTSYELRAAEWQPRPEAPRVPVVLGFAGFDGLPPDLVAIRAADGKEAWRCPTDYPGSGEPNLFEVDRGHLALMEGSQTCGRCDPPFAHSTAAFHVFDTPGLFPAAAPWPGSFGGPAHHGQELPVYQPPVKTFQSGVEQSTGGR